MVNIYLLSLKLGLDATNSTQSAEQPLCPHPAFERQQIRLLKDR
jgi:hypothetical protein